MKRKTFAIRGNICGDRVRLGRAMQKPPITQEDLAIRVQFLGLESFTKMTINRIEINKRHVIDAELKALAKALNVTIDWLLENIKIMDIR